MAMLLPLSAVECYLTLERSGSPVETDAVHSWAEVLGFSEASENFTTIQELAQGSTSYGKGTPATMVMKSDRSIASMMDALAKSQACNLRLHVVRSDSSSPVVLMEFDFNEIYFTNVQAKGASGEDDLLFEVSFVYSSLVYTQTYFNQQSEAYAVKVGHDYLTNEFAGIQGTQVPQTGDYDESSTVVDTDSDGIPDSWEDSNGLNKNDSKDANLDKDGDGFTNKQEFLAGTNPNQLSSYFKVSIHSATNAVILSWDGVAGRTYRVMESTQPSTGYTQVYQVVPTLNGTRSYSPAGGLGKFYKLEVNQ
ncbi:hypothetical protein Rhal01_01569 [Rubritalea halochordaticola]|uniref:Type VI secretion system tube protein Hcp n=2 Tax=Rubritalea halochordaticola TaxID=714537 RepID=A0ABP9V1B6_9BACT